MTCRTRSIADPPTDPPAVGRGNAGKHEPRRDRREDLYQLGTATRQYNTIRTKSGRTGNAVDAAAPFVPHMGQGVGRFCPLRPRNPLNIGRASRRTPRVEAIGVRVRADRAFGGDCGDGGGHCRPPRADAACRPEGRGKDFRLHLRGLPQEPAGTCEKRAGRRLPAPALHDRTGNERRDGGLSGRRRQCAGRQERSGRSEGRPAGGSRREGKIQKAGGRRPAAGRPQGPQGAAHAARQATGAGEVARRQDDGSSVSRIGGRRGSPRGTGGRREPGRGRDPRGAGASGGSDTVRWSRSTSPCRRCRPRRRTISLSRFSLPRPCPDRWLLLRASRRTPPPRPLRCSASSVSSRRCVTFSPRA